jgi:hypothetical protein
MLFLSQVRARAGVLNALGCNDASISWVCLFQLPSGHQRLNQFLRRFSFPLPRCSPGRPSGYRAVENPQHPSVMVSHQPVGHDDT